MLLEDDVAAIKEYCCVHGRLSGIGGSGKGHSGEDGCGNVACCRSEFVYGFAATSKEAGLLKEVGWRVTANGQLRKNSQAGTMFSGALDSGDDLVEIAGEPPDRRVDLGQCDLHRFSLIKQAPEGQGGKDQDPGTQTEHP